LTHPIFFLTLAVSAIKLNNCLDGHKILSVVVVCACSQADIFFLVVNQMYLT